MGKYFSSIIVLFIGANCFSQTTQRSIHKDLVFDEVSITENISYRNSIQNIKEKYFLLDIYEAKEDNNSLRPLIIWMHGGGFKYGNKKSNGTPVWSKTFAQRGYICAAINYRLSKKHPLRNFTDLVDGCMDAIEDLRSAIAFFKQNHLKYRIDTNRIVLAGNSAGAMMALQAVYSSPYEMGALIKQPGFDTLSRIHNPDKIAAIISCWGALYDSTWLKNEMVPIAIIFGSKDKIVPPENKGPLSGGNVIYRQGLSLGIPVALKSFEGYGHELQKSFNPFWAGNKAKKRWLEAGQFAADFLYTHLGKENKQ